LRIGVPENHYFDRLDPAVAKAVEAMIDLAGKLFGSVEKVRVPDVEALNTVGRVILLAEASAAMERYFERFDEIGADVRVLLEQGRLIPAADYINAQRLRRQMRDEFFAVFERVDLLLTPVTPTGAGRIGEATVKIGGVEEDFRLATTRLVRGVNVLGIPAMSLPCGFDGEGMPVGMQILGRAFGEADVLAAGAALEDETGYWEREPGMAS
jgi:aspartyl-tRNA(Asn)/glutamyl-tRNA(Gln) amidotransferase subunit A